MIIAISDAHLGFNCNVDQLVKFLESKVKENSQVTDLVMLGDMLDYAQSTRINITLDGLPRFADVLYDIKKRGVKIYYVYGNHDIGISEFKNVDNTPFSKIDEKITLADGDKDFHFIHGYQYEVAARARLDMLYKPLLKLYTAFFKELNKSGDAQNRIASEVWDIITSIQLPIDEYKSSLKKSLTPALSFTYKKNGKSLYKAHVPESLQGLSYKDAANLMLMLGMVPEKDVPVLQKNLDIETSLDFDTTIGETIKFFINPPKKRFDLKFSSSLTPPLFRASYDDIINFAVKMKPKDADFLVFGHTHQTKQNGEIINMGSWTRESKKLSYLEIEDGTPVIKTL